MTQHHSPRSPTRTFTLHPTLPSTGPTQELLRQCRTSSKIVKKFIAPQSRFSKNWPKNHAGDKIHRASEAGSQPSLQLYGTRRRQAILLLSLHHFHKVETRSPGYFACDTSGHWVKFLRMKSEIHYLVSVILGSPVPSQRDWGERTDMAQILLQVT